MFFYYMKWPDKWADLIIKLQKISYNLKQNNEPWSISQNVWQKQNMEFFQLICGKKQKCSNHWLSIKYKMKYIWRHRGKNEKNQRDSVSTVEWMQWEFISFINFQSWRSETLQKIRAQWKNPAVDVTAVSHSRPRISFRTKYEKIICTKIIT